MDDDGRMVLRADANATALGLVCEINVDLTKTPYVNRSWKVENVYHGNKEHSKKGDDYPAHVYKDGEKRGLVRGHFLHCKIIMIPTLAKSKD